MKYRYSYSGADVKAWVYMEQNPSLMVPLESLHTISISVHEAKGMARSLGHRGIVGIARGVRTIAGSIIFTVIEDNPLVPVFSLLDPEKGLVVPTAGWSIDMYEMGVGTALDRFNFVRKLAPLIPPFNIFLQYASEGSAFAKEYEPSRDSKDIVLNADGAGLLVRGVEFIDEGIVTSVNDVVSEVTLSFIAHDFKPLSSMEYGVELDSASVMNEDFRKDQLVRRKLTGGTEDREATRRALETLGWKVGR